MMLFYGHDLTYWIELERRFKEQNGSAACDLLDEIVALQGKVAFYESRVKDMAAVASRK